MTQAESAVLVLAAGAGTRMRSDIPKVLHTLAGRSMLAHALHAVAKVAPQHLVVVLGHDRDAHHPGRRRAGRRRWAARSRSRSRISSSAPDTPSAAGWPRCPPTSRAPSSSPPATCPLLDADTLADLIATHSAETAAATVLTTTVPDPTGYGRILRTQDGEVIGIVEEADATRSQRAIREVNAGVYAFDIDVLRSALSRLRPHNAQQELYLTDVISIVRADGQSRAGQARRRRRAGRRASTTASSCPNWPRELNRRIVAAHQRAGRDGRRPAPAPGSTST